MSRRAQLAAAFLAAVSLVLAPAAASGERAGTPVKAKAAKLAAAKAKAKAKQRARAAVHRRALAVAMDDNLVANPSFEASLSGWSNWRASLARASGGAGGSYSARVKSSGKGTFSLYPYPRPVSATVSGTAYSATAWVRSGSSRTVCVQIREWASSPVGSAERCVSASSAWRQVPSVSYTAKGSGNALEVYAYSSATKKGQAFDVDVVSLREADVTAPETTITSAPSGTVLDGSASIEFSASEPSSFQCELDGAAWASCSSPKGYDALAEGAHTFRVRAVDAAGNVDATPAAATWTVEEPVSATAPVAVECTLFASTSGSDSAAGTATAPLRTVRRLLEALAPGQTGCLAAGEVFEESLSLSRGGEPGSPITVTSADPSRAATIRGRIVTKPGADHLTFSRLRLNGVNADRLPSPTIGSAHVVFSHNDITNDHTAICFNLIDSSTWGTARNTVIDSNRIHDCGRLPATNYDHGIYVSGYDVVVTNNYIYGNADRGVQLRGAQRAVVRNNVIDGNGEGVIFGDLGASNNEVAYNVITNSLIRYNVESWWGTSTVGTGNTAHHNCVWNGAHGNIQSPNGFAAYDNKTADPLFVDRAAGDFRLAPGSPCAGMGPA